MYIQCTKKMLDNWILKKSGWFQQMNVMMEQMVFTPGM